MKKGNEKAISNVNFKDLDSKKVPHGMEHKIKVTNNNESGIAIFKIFGPTTKKGCTLMTNKAKKSDTKFVEILTIDIVKQLLSFTSRILES